VLTRDNLVPAHHGFGAAQVDRDVAVLDPLDQTIDDLASAVLVFFELALPFRFAHLLHDDLLRGLRGDPSEIDRRQTVDNELANDSIGLFAARAINGHLFNFVFQLFRLDYFDITGQHDFSGLTINGRANIVLHAVFGPASLLNGLLHRFQHQFAFDRFFPGHRIGDCQHIGPRNRNSVHRPQVLIRND